MSIVKFVAPFFLQHIPNYNLLSVRTHWKTTATTVFIFFSSGYRRKGTDEKRLEHPSSHHSRIAFYGDGEGECTSIVWKIIHCFCYSVIVVIISNTLKTKTGLPNRLNFAKTRILFGKNYFLWHCSMISHIKRVVSNYIYSFVLLHTHWYSIVLVYSNL